MTFSIKMPSPSSSSLSLSCKKTLIRTLFLSQIRRLVHALSSAKSFLVEVSRKGSSGCAHFFFYLTRNKKNDKIYFGSFRLHYNWCSSRYWSVPASVLRDSSPASATSQVSYYDTSSTWRYRDTGGGDNSCHEPAGLSGYLQWLEEENVRGDVTAGEKDDDRPPGRNEIDRLADLFIARCHEKFILEKQESDRRFQEMLARSM